MPDLSYTPAVQAERLRAAARLLDHLADNDVPESDRDAVEGAVRRHLEVAGVLT